MSYKQKILEIKYKMQIGLVSYYEAKAEAEPIINEMNEKGKVIAKKHNQKFKPFTFASLIR